MFTRATYRNLRRPLFVSTVASVLLVFTGGAAGASVLAARIHECAKLYKLRNDFYNEKGLCFTRSGAKKLYPDNAETCVYSSSRNLPMTVSEDKAVSIIVDKERELGCDAIRP